MRQTTAIWQFLEKINGKVDWTSLTEHERDLHQQIKAVEVDLSEP